MFFYTVFFLTRIGPRLAHIHYACQYHFNPGAPGATTVELRGGGWRAHRSGILWRAFRLHQAGFEASLGQAFVAENLPTFRGSIRRHFLELSLVEIICLVWVSNSIRFLSLRPRSLPEDRRVFPSDSGGGTAWSSDNVT